MEKTLEAATSVITAPYLEYFDIRFEVPPDFEFPYEDVENVVTQYRELKSKFVNVANDMGDANDEGRAKDLLGFIAFRQRTRDKRMTALSGLLCRSDLVLNLVIVQLCANAKTVLC